MSDNGLLPEHPAVDPTHPYSSQVRYRPNYVAKVTLDCTSCETGYTLNLPFTALQSLETAGILVSDATTPYQFATCLACGHRTVRLTGTVTLNLPPGGL